MGYAIGNFNFVSMSQPSLRPAQQPHIEARPGVNGVAVWKTGTRGVPFVVRTMVDVLTPTGAVQLFALYRNAILTEPMVFEFMIPHDHPVLVLDVQPVPGEVSAVLIGVGGVNGLSQGICRAEWTLLPLTIESQ